MGRAFTIEIDMRWADLDAYGHVNNAVIFSYLETARVKLLLEPGIDLMQGALQTLVAGAEMTKVGHWILLMRSATLQPMMARSEARSLSENKTPAANPAVWPISRLLFGP